MALNPLEIVLFDNKKRGAVIRGSVIKGSLYLISDVASNSASSIVTCMLLVGVL